MLKSLEKVKRHFSAASQGVPLKAKKEKNSMQMYTMLFMLCVK